jgi:hypothetical protein
MAVAALLSVALGVISDLLRTNRTLLEEQLERIKTLQYGAPAAPGVPPAGGEVLEPDDA